MLRFVAAVVLICMLTGCDGDQRILENLGMVQTSSYDLGDNNKLRVTSSLPIPDPDATLKRIVLTAETDSIKEARLIFSNQTELDVVSGQLRNTLFGLNLAKDGLGSHIDTLLRDPSVALGVKVTIVNGEASELLAKNYKQHQDTGQYITRLLEKESTGNTIPKITLYEFSRDYNDDGIDPVAPLLKDAGEHAAVDGIALFQDDRYIMKIPAKDGLIFAIFRGTIKQGEIALDLEDSTGQKESVMFSSVSSKRKVKVHHLDRNRFKVDITASIQGSVLEYTGQHKLFKKDQRLELEKLIADHISSRAEQMIKEMQQNKVDSLGIGQYVRNSLSYAEWKNLDWRKVYPEIEVECHSKVLIKDYGKYTRTKG
ncbi:Ger(x)C family spore germination protein [Paenibacillus sp. BR2-3]|uniref:Ger(x)C family spore germination protein n=1 Tax=Paenibacillus sp. BR2-3 TaxID=3048494 RepID=UPI00397760E5